MPDAAPTNSVNGAMLSPRPADIGVASGGFVSVLDPQPDTILIEDIARGLANTCRYGGQVKRFYSVAEHSVLVHDLLQERGAGPDTLCAALLHDAAEAFLGDVVSPLKWALRYQTIADNALYHGPWPPDPAGSESAYDRLAGKMDGAIAVRFGLDGRRIVDADVALADMWALRIEARELMTDGGASWRWPGELPLNGMKPLRVQWVGGIQPAQAERLWLGLASERGLREARAA
jgi:hypothetical protein